MRCVCDGYGDVRTFKSHVSFRFIFGMLTCNVTWAYHDNYVWKLDFWMKNWNGKLDCVCNFWLDRIVNSRIGKWLIDLENG